MNRLRMIDLSAYAFRTMPLVGLVGWCACVHVSFQAWEDDLVRNRQRGGYFQYIRHEEGFWEKAHKEQGLAKAKQWCGPQRHVGLLHQEEATSYRAVTTHAMVNHGLYGYGGFAGYDGFGGYGGYGWGWGMGPHWMMGTSTTSLQPVLAARVYFACQDMDVQEPTATLLFHHKSAAPRCVSWPGASGVGRQRLRVLREQVENIDCVDEQGWLQVWTADQLQFLFVGQQGLERCLALETASVAALITKEQLPLWLRQQLICSASSSRSQPPPSVAPTELPPNPP